MQPIAFSPWWLIYVGLSLLVLLGMFLVCHGLYPRRVGTTPYCRKCGYNLTGTDRTADDARCPECGSNVCDDSAVVFGERVRRWRRVFAGMVIFLFGTAPLGVIGIGVARGIDWYRYKPTLWVLRDLEKGNAALAQRAIAEIQRRRTAGGLSPGHLHRLTQVCLVEQGRQSWRTTVGDWALGFLDERYCVGQLTQEQAERYFTQMYPVTYRVRPVVLAGEPVAYRVEYERRMPVGVASECEIGPIELDGQRIAAALSSWRDDGRRYDTEASIGSHVTVSDPGRHRLATTFSAEFFVGASPNEGSPDYTVEIPLEATFEVVERLAKPTRTVRSAELDRVILANIKVSKLSLVPGDTDTGRRLMHGRVVYGKDRPIGIAFDVIAETDGARVPVGAITMPPAGRADFRAYHFSGEWVADVEPETVDLLLLANPDVQRTSVDVYDVWGGSLRCERVPVEISKERSYGYSSSEPLFDPQLLGTAVSNRPPAKP